MKQHFTRLLYCSFLLFWLNPIVAEDANDSYLYLVCNDGREDINLGAVATLRSLTFNIAAEEQTLQANLKDGTSQAYDINAIERLYFASQASGIDNPMQESYKGVYIENGLLYTGDIPEGQAVYIYSIDGRVVKSFKVNGTSVEVKDLPKGIYLLKVNGQTSKLLKR